MLVILKIPVVYLCAVVWWAIRAEPRPLEGARCGSPSLGPGPDVRLAERDVPACSGAVQARAGRGAAAGLGRPARLAHALRTGDVHERRRARRAVGPLDGGRHVAGLLATVSIFTSCVGLVYRPVRLIPFAILLALVAARMSERQQRLGGRRGGGRRGLLDLGMTIAVVTENPLY